MKNSLHPQTDRQEEASEFIPPSIPRNRLLVLEEELWLNVGNAIRGVYRHCPKPSPSYVEATPNPSPQILRLCRIVNKIKGASWKPWHSKAKPANRGSGSRVKSLG